MMIGSFSIPGVAASTAPEEGGFIRKSRWKWLALGAVLVLVAFYLLRSELLKRGFRGTGFIAPPGQLDWKWLPAALVAALATYYGRALRWAVLLRPLRPHPD